MKKVFAVIAALVLAVPSFAQYSSGGFSLSESSVYYGIRLGMNISSLTGDDMPATHKGSKVGLNFAPVIGLRVSDTTPIFLESGLYYAGAGSKKDKNSVSLNYLEIPILIKYGIQATDEIAVLPFIGPTVRWGIFGGDTKTAGYENVGSFSDDNPHKAKRTDFGIKLGCGAEYNKLYLELGYHWGITNIADWKVNATDDAVIHNGAFFINLGMNF